MATLYITEYSNPGFFNGNPSTYPLEPESRTQLVTLGASSTQTASALLPSTQVVRVSTDTVAGIAFGSNPTAGASSRRQPANTTEFYAVPLSSSLKVAAITP